MADKKESRTQSFIDNVNKKDKMNGKKVVSICKTQRK